MKEYTTYLFDVGGTLITFDEVRRAHAYVARARQVGARVAVPEMLRVLEQLNHELPERSRHVQLSLLPVPEQRAFWTDFWAEGFRQIGVSDADAARFVQELLDPVNGGNFQKVYDDVRPVLDALLARGKRLAVISNFSPNCQALLQEMGLAHYFDFFIVSGIVGIEKPDARIFQLAVRAAGKPISELVYIGDSVYHDIEGAQAAGMDAILIDRAQRFPTLETARITDLRELLNPQVSIQ